MASAFAGVDLAVVREAVFGEGIVRLELDFNLFGGQALVYVYVTDPAFPRRKPKMVLPGPLVGDDHSTLLRALADILDETIESLVVTDPRDEP